MESSHLSRVRLLYKTVLKLHKGLPGDLQLLGNSYAREEFKRHKNCNPSETAIFMIEWTKYAMTLADQLGLRGIRSASKIGDTLTDEKLENMSDEQICQVYELYQASQSVEEDVSVEQTFDKNKTQ